MKKRILTVFMAALMALTLLLPVGAVTLPNDPLLSTARTHITKSVGTDTAGAAVGIISGGERLLLEGFGYADISAQSLISPDTVFEIGDASGIFVALAAFSLADRGVLDLTESIATYLPADFYEKLELAYPVTVEQLLLGCAGFDGRTFDLSFDKASHRFDTLEKALLAEVPEQMAEPGAFYSYSPFGIALAAYVVECAAGEPYADYVETNILTPLEMTDTFLDPDEATAADKRASGHKKITDGTFAVAANEGRSYAGLYPASGAISTPEDMAALLAFLLDGNATVLSDASRIKWCQTVFENGLFSVSAPALSVQGRALGVRSETMCFGTSFWLDSSAGIGAFVMTNTVGSTLLSLPAEMCGATVGRTTDMMGQMPDLDTFEGVYATANSENRSFVGRMLRKDNGREAVANEDGTLSFLGMKLKQIAPCVFANAEGDTQTALVQFLLDEEGEVVRVVTADGETYHPVSFFEKKTPANVLLYMMLVLTVGFLFAGIVSLMKYMFTRYDEDHKGFVYTLPLIFSTLMSVFVLLQIWVGLEHGASAFSSFFGAMSVLTLLCSIGAIAGFLMAFVASLTRRRMPARVARSAVLFIAFLLLVNYWGLSIL